MLLDSRRYNPQKLPRDARFDIDVYRPREVHILIGGKADPQLAGHKLINRCIVVLENSTTNIHPNPGETEGPISLAQCNPKFIQVMDFAKSSVEVLQTRPCIDHSPKGAGKKHLARHFKFDITKMLHTNPGADAEQDDDNPAELVLKSSEHQGGGCRNTADPVQKKRCSTRLQPAIEQHVMNVPSVGPEDRLMTQEAP